MREILFRGKRIAGHRDSTKDGTMLYGSLFIDKNGQPKIKWYNERYGASITSNVDPETVGQFTGLTDKNGKKIFEGDIGRYKQTDGATQNGKPITCIGKVIYNAKTASFAMESKDEAGRKYFDYFPIKDFEVFGNIHDNPELLEVTDNA